VVATPDSKTLEFMAEATRDRELTIPISRKLPLSKAGEAQAAAEEGGSGKVLIVCRMPGVTERLVVSSPSVCEVWTHRLLRQFSEPGCVQACGDNRASDHCQLRAG
jgi:hypothetical protein